MENRKRKLQTATDALVNVRRENWKKAVEAQKKSEKCKIARSKNACKAVSIRTARAILKHLPLGYKVGDTIQVTRYRKITVIDEKPVERKITENGTERTVWEQKFTQSGSIRIYGQEHCFSGRCRIVWNYLPTYENILDSPMLEEENQENKREKTAVFDQRPLSAERE